MVRDMGLPRVRSSGNLLLSKIKSEPPSLYLWSGGHVRTGDSIWEHLACRCSTNGNQSYFIGHNSGALFQVSGTQKALWSSGFLLLPAGVSGEKWKQMRHLMQVLLELPANGENRHKPKEFHCG